MESQVDHELDPGASTAKITTDIRRVLRSQIRRQSQQRSLIGMAIQAAVWRANLEERALPELIQDYAKTTAYRPAPEAVDLQRKWLASANSSADVDSYFRALIYSLGDNNVLFRSLSSDSMSQIAVVAAVAGRGTGTGELKILDLAAGSGSMLVSLGRAAEDLGFTPSLRGSEISPEISVLAASGLFLSQMESVVRQADSLIQDPFDTFAADLAVSQPPFGLSWRNVSDSVRARQSNDNWYNLGLPDTGDSTWLFASRLIEKLQDPEVGGGRAVTFCTLRSLISPSASQLREQLLNRDLLESVILLPSGITETARPLCGLVFNNLKASKRHGRVQIVDLRAWIQQSHLRTAPKRLRPEALLALSDALDSPRDGVISRTVRRDYFLRTRVGVAPDNCDHNNRSSVRWEINLPREEQVVAQLSSRYGPVSVRAKGPGKQVCDIIFNDLFDSAANHVHKWLRINNFPVTRLSALLTSPPILLSKDDAPPTDVSEGLLLPTSPSLAAKVATEDPEREGMNPALLLSVDSSTVVPEYLAAWLNSALGIESRESASQLQVSATGLPTKMDRMGSIRFCDAILVPLPPMTTQHEFINTELRLSATNNLVNAARREVWATPARMKEIRQQFEPLFDQSLEKWIDNLPYPVASAFWYLQTSASQSTEAAHRQIFLAWEAYTAFFATVLLSALAQDPILREEERPRIRRALRQASAGIERATLGTWSVIVQRLSGHFRRQLASNDLGVQAAVIQTFGGAGRACLQRLLDPDVVTLVTDANHKRNIWAGHGGASRRDEQKEHLEYLTDKLAQLRDVVGDAWAELKCVRAGSGSKIAGRISQTVELVMGTRVPFKETLVQVGEMMERDELYLCADGTAQPLPLEHFVVLRRAPTSARFTSYFYNRLDRGQVRLVSYEVADSSELTEDVAGFQAAIEGLLDATSPVE